MVEKTASKLRFTVAGSPVFVFNIRFFQPSDLHCYLMRDGDEIELVRGTDFTVENKSDYSGGANITLTPGGDNLPDGLPAGAILTIARELPPLQQVSLPEYGKIPSSALEAQLDKFAMLFQQFRDHLLRSFSVPHGMENYDNDSIYRSFSQLVTNAGTWAAEAKSGALQAEAASDRAAADAIAARDAAAEASASRDEAGASADNAGRDASEIRDIAAEAALDRATLAYGDWGADGIYISYNEWTPAHSLIALPAHNLDPAAHPDKAPLNSPAFSGSPTVPDAAANESGSRAVNARWVRTVIGTGLVPPGVVAPFAGPTHTIPAGWFLCDGREISRETYSALWYAIGGYYGNGNGSTTFNIPDFRGMFLRGYLSGTSGELGRQQGESLPNLTGSIVKGSEHIHGDGALFKDQGAEYHPFCAHGLDASSNSNTSIRFDASACNPVYGRSSHVTPVNYAVTYIIKY